MLPLAYASGMHTCSLLPQNTCTRPHPRKPHQTQQDGGLSQLELANVPDALTKGLTTLSSAAACWLTRMGQRVADVAAAAGWDDAWDSQDESSDTATKCGSVGGGGGAALLAGAYACVCMCVHVYACVCMCVRLCVSGCVSRKQLMELPTPRQHTKTAPSRRQSCRPRACAAAPP
jgi:hypothetical protein